MRKIQISLLPRLLLITAIFALGACSSSSGSGRYASHPWKPQNEETVAQSNPDALTDAATGNAALPKPDETASSQSESLPPVKVAILLPLSGQHQKLGQSMLQAAQLALFDIGFDNFELVPKDTAGTPTGARAAAQSALQDGAKLILGPLFAESVRAAKQVTQSANINMVAFSTDWTLANGQTYLISFMPFDQVERVISYAKQSGLYNIGVLSPSDDYGNGVVSAYRSIANTIGVQTVNTARFSPNGQDLFPAVRSLSESMKSQPLDAILMPVGGAMARQVGTFLTSNDMPPSKVRRLGTGLMDDAILATDKNLNGLWFAAPDPASRRKFEYRYQSTYGEKPPRIASLAYDATALAAVLARTGLRSTGRPAFGSDSITNPNGFAGVDGIFRFRPDGISERGLAVMEYKNGRIKVIDPAPTSFRKYTY